MFYIWGHVQSPQQWPLGMGIILMITVNVGIRSTSEWTFGLVLSGTLLWAPCCAVFEQSISRNVDWTWGPAAWTSWFLDLIPLEFVMWKHLKGHVYTVHARTVDLMARLDTGVTMIIVNVFQCVWEYTMWHTAVCPEADKGFCEQLLQQKVPMS
jgi:hypothetical protein